MKDRHPEYSFVPLSNFNKLVKAGYDSDRLETLLMSISMTGSTMPSEAPSLKWLEKAGLFESALMTAAQWLRRSAYVSKGVSDAAESIGFITHWDHRLGSLICCRVVQATALRLVSTKHLLSFSDCKRYAIDSAKKSSQPIDAIERVESIFRDITNWGRMPSAFPSLAMDVAYASARGDFDKRAVGGAMFWISSLLVAAECATSMARRERRRNRGEVLETPKYFKKFHKLLARQVATESLLGLLGVCSKKQGYAAYDVIRKAGGAYADRFLSDSIDYSWSPDPDELGYKMEDLYSKAISDFEVIAKLIAAEMCEDFLLRDKTQDELDDEVSYAATLPSRGASSRSVAAPLLIGAAAGAAALAAIKKAKS